MLITWYSSTYFRNILILNSKSKEHCLLVKLSFYRFSIKFIDRVVYLFRHFYFGKILESLWFDTNAIMRPKRIYKITITITSNIFGVIYNLRINSFHPNLITFQLKFKHSKIKSSRNKESSIQSLFSSKQTISSPILVSQFY